MLTPEYLWSVADPVVQIWEELNRWALMDICQRIMAAVDQYHYNHLPGTARYHAWLLNQSGMHYEEMISVIAALTKKSEKEVKRLFEEAGLIALDNDKIIYENQGVSIPDIRTNSGLLTILNEVYQRTNGELKNYTRTTLINSQKQCYDSLDRAYMAIKSGHRSYTEVIKESIEELAKNMTEVTYPSGHKDSLEVAVRRAVMTGINQGTGKVSIENALNNGYEYVVVDAHIGARVNDKDKIANHAGWQGKIFKIEGATAQYKNLEEETGFPNNPLGLCGYNCRHHFFPYMPGAPNPFEQNIPDEKENRKAYELSQKQRYMERKIRERKRELLGLDTCINNCSDEKTKFELQMEYDKKAAKLQEQNKAYNKFCDSNGLRREADRLQPARWNQDQGNHARGAAKRYQTADQSAKQPSYNTQIRVSYNAQKAYRIDLERYDKSICDGLSHAARKVAELGSKDRWEYCKLVNLKTGKTEFTHTDEEFGSVGGFYNFLSDNKENDYAFIHNHNTDSTLSLPDLQILASEDNIKLIAAVRNDGIISLVESNGKKTEEYLYSYYEKELKEYERNNKNQDNSIPLAVLKELYGVKIASEEFGKGLIIIDDR